MGAIAVLTPAFEVVASFGHRGLFELRAALPSLQRLLTSLEPLQKRGIISAIIPVWRRGIDGRGHVDDRVVFRVHSSTHLDRVKSLGFRDLRAARGLPLTWTARAPGGDAVGVTNRLSDDDTFVWIEPDWFFWPKPMWTPDDPLLERAWHLAAEGVAGLRAEAAWDIVRGSGVRVGVIDTGIQIDHPDLNILAGYDVIGGDDIVLRPPTGPAIVQTVANNARFMESHGTAVAGITAATGNNALGTTGVCPEYLVLGVRMIGRTAGRRRSHADAIRWLSDRRAAVNGRGALRLADTFPGLAEALPMQQQAGRDSERCSCMLRGMITSRIRESIRI